LDVRKLGCDFYAFSGHKAYAPTGVGALWGRAELLEAMPPWQGGGEMIASVAFDAITYADPPHRFEAGTPDIFGAMALGAALEWLSGLDRAAVARHEAALLAHAEGLLDALPGVRRVGRAPERAAVLSFVVEGLHPHDVGTILDLEGVAVRTGHHCAEPAMTRLGLEGGTVRASFAPYNTFEEVERMVQGVLRAQEVLTR
ncbi:MAG: aminotransferase class V-fold PLP-dependent enzyme, partial [Myxococcales bacterium]|nr:aminotransferase class V-fold PLP-dependent enzyme [Myxococcales bacterium]